MKPKNALSLLVIGTALLSAGGAQAVVTPGFELQTMSRMDLSVAWVSWPSVAEGGGFRFESPFRQFAKPDAVKKKKKKKVKKSKLQPLTPVVGTGGGGTAPGGGPTVVGGGLGGGGEELPGDDGGPLDDVLDDLEDLDIAQVTGVPPGDAGSGLTLGDDDYLPESLPGGGAPPPAGVQAQSSPPTGEPAAAVPGPASAALLALGLAALPLARRRRARS